MRASACASRRRNTIGSTRSAEPWHGDDAEEDVEDDDDEDDEDDEEEV